MALPSVPHLKWLDVSNCCISDDGLAALGDTLSSDRWLTELHLSNNHGITDMAPLLAVLASGALPRLTVLDLAGCYLGDEGCVTLASAFRHMPRLTRLLLSNCQIGDAGLLAIADAMRRGWCPAVDFLHTEHNSMTSLVVAAAFARAVVHMPALKSDSLADTEMQHCGRSTATSQLAELASHPDWQDLLLWSRPGWAPGGPNTWIPTPT